MRAPDGFQYTSTQFRVSDWQPDKSKPTPTVNYSDVWWNPQESGWGLSIKQWSGDLLFAAWFVYDAAGNPTWYTLQPGGWTSMTSYTGPIYRATGPSFAGPFSPAMVAIAQVGTGTLTFDTPASGTFSFNVSGASGSRHIERF